MYHRDLWAASLPFSTTFQIRVSVASTSHQLGMFVFSRPLDAIATAGMRRIIYKNPHTSGDGSDRRNSIYINKSRVLIASAKDRETRIN
jgi:hypothetical protein